MSEIEKRLQEMGLALPPVPKPLAEYVPAKVVGSLVLTSGQLPMREGKLIRVGKVGLDLTVDEARECARVCALNCLAAVQSVAGDLDRIEEVMQLRGFVQSAPGFEGQPEVLNGASQLLVQLLGERGRHARSAVGVSALPRNAPVELEMIVRLKSN